MWYRDAAGTWHDRAFDFGRRTQLSRCSLELSRRQTFRGDIPRSETAPRGAKTCAECRTAPLDARRRRRWVRGGLGHFLPPPPPWPTQVTLSAETTVLLAELAARADLSWDAYLFRKLHRLAAFARGKTPGVPKPPIKPQPPRPPRQRRARPLREAPAAAAPQLPLHEPLSGPAVWPSPEQEDAARARLEAGDAPDAVARELDLAPAVVTGIASGRRFRRPRA